VRVADRRRLLLALSGELLRADAVDFRAVDFRGVDFRGVDFFGDPLPVVSDLSGAAGVGAG
jgi:uncharacterized protein YjbI with pentapeptide repeats